MTGYGIETTRIAPTLALRPPKLPPRSQPTLALTLTLTLILTLTLELTLTQPLPITLIVFYRQSKHLGLQMEEMVPFFKKNQSIKCLLLSTSSDENVCKLYQVRADRDHQVKQSNDPVAKVTWHPTVELKPVLSEAKARKMIQGTQSGAWSCSVKEEARCYS